MKPGYSLWQLEKYLQGELSAAEQEQVSRAVANDPKLAAYLQRAKAWNEEALNLRLPPLPKALPQANPSANRGWSDLLDRLQNTWQAWTRPAWGKPGLALATLVLLVGLISLP
jgi:anti-sigma factor RsiW